jgi:alcohol dehydrogenase
MLLKLALEGKLDTGKLITHSTSPMEYRFNYRVTDDSQEFSFEEMEDAYGTFGAAAKHSALKVLIDFS